MQFAVTFRHMDATEALKAYAKDRLSCVRKYFPDPITCHVVLSTERHNHTVDVNLKLHNGYKVGGTETTENMYSSIDLVAAKIERQVRRYKDKLREHKVREMTPLPVLHSILAERWHAHELAHAEPAVAEHPEHPETAGKPTPEPQIIERETVSADPLSVSEAVMQMNLLGAPFLVFRNDQSGQINVVYKRKDGYGLIETSPPA
jgi:putative sigma-54 modulation protein